MYRVLVAVLLGALAVAVTGCTGSLRLGSNIPVVQFRHLARWNPDWRRIEMHLEALDDVAFTVSGQRIAMLGGETIHTENSHKYSPDQARLMLQAGGWTPTRLWTDPSGDFLLALAEATERRSAP